MVCRFCHKKIGFLRRQFDQEFCCRAHRKSASTRSAKAVRDSGDWDPAADAAFQVIQLDAPQRKGNSDKGNLVIATLACTLVFTAIFIRDGQPAGADSNGESTGLLTRYVRSFASMLPSGQKTELREDFKNGLSQWTGSGADWSYYAGNVRPGRLRVWGASTSLADYRFEFVGEIQKSGLGWAYRARDPQNYYANQIVLGKTGPLPGADLVRYTVLNGREFKRTRLPLPALIKRDTPYEIRMDIRGTQFTTSVNGRIVDTWSDDLLRIGGVGLFTEKGQVATIRSAKLAEYKEWITSAFSMALLPLPRL